MLTIIMEMEVRTLIYVLSTDNHKFATQPKRFSMRTPQFCMSPYMPTMTIPVSLRLDNFTTRTEPFLDFTGAAKEEGEKEGKGFNHNFPLPRVSTGDDAYCKTLTRAVGIITNFNPSYLVVR